jgi:hypothetical protein
LAAAAQPLGFATITTCLQALADERLNQFGDLCSGSNGASSLGAKLEFAVHCPIACGGCNPLTTPATDDGTPDAGTAPTTDVDVGAWTDLLRGSVLESTGGGGSQPSAVPTAIPAAGGGVVLLGKGPIPRVIDKVQTQITSRFSAAVRFRARRGRGGYVFAKTSANGAVRYLGLYLSSVTKQTRVYYTVKIEDGSSSGKFELLPQVIRYDLDLTDGKEHEVVLAIDTETGSGQGGFVDLNVDGGRVGPIGPATAGEVAGGVTVADCGRLGPDCVVYIGQRASKDGAGAHKFVGIIDQVLFFPNRTLAAFP